jgi:hypothetical protein
MVYNDLENLDHDKKLAVALGNLVIIWARAESALVGVLARVTGMNINTAMLSYYRIPTFDVRAKFLQTLLGEWKPEKDHKPGQFDKVAIAKEVDGLRGLSAARNDWVHGVWCANKDKSETVIFDFRAPEDKGRRKPVKAPDVDNHVAAVLKRELEIERLIDRGSMYGE